MNNYYFAILFCLWTLCSCNFLDSKHSNNNLSKLQCLISDFHSNFDRYNKSENIPLEISVCFFEHDSSVYAALAGLERSDVPTNLLLYASVSEEFKMREDMLGYCIHGNDRLAVYSSVKYNKSRFIEPYIGNLMLQDASEVYKEQYEYITSDVMLGEYYHYFCVYQIDSCSNYCLVDSGHYYQLKFHDFYYNNWPQTALGASGYPEHIFR